MLKDSALTCIPPLLRLVNSSPAQADSVLSLIAENADPREVVLALNIQLEHFAEQADPYAVSDSDDEDSDDEDSSIDWATAFPQVERIIDLYAIGKCTVTREKYSVHELTVAHPQLCPACRRSAARRPF